MDFGKAFTFVFDDPNWLKKIVLAALVSLIPIIGQFFLIGWSLEVARRVITHNPTPLPDLDFGGSLSLGFKSFLIGLVYSIPIILLTLPISLLGALTSNNSQSDALNAVMAIVSICCGGLILIYAIALAFFMPAAHGNFLAKNQLSAAFRVGEVWGLIKAAPGPYLMVVLGEFLAGFIAPLGSIACAIGVLLTSAYAAVVVAHLFGQAYNEAAPRSTVF